MYCALSNYIHKQEQVVLEQTVEGERVVVVVIATRVISRYQNFSIVSNGTKRFSSTAQHFAYHACNP
jgi:hypothetical protein